MAMTKGLKHQKCGAFVSGSFPSCELGRRKLPSSLILHSENRPHIHRSRKRKNKAGEQDGRGAPLKLTVFPIVEVRHAQLCKEKHGEDEVDCGENHIVNYLLDLTRGVIPSPLDGAGDITGSEGGRRHADADQKNEAEGCNALFAFHDVISPFHNNWPLRVNFSAALLIRLRVYRGNVPILPQITLN